MRFSKIMCALICATSMVSAPVMAQSLSPSERIAKAQVKRAAPAVKKESRMDGSVSPFLIAGVIAAGLIIYFIVDDDDEPDSP